VALTAAEVAKNGFPVPDSVREGAANLEADLLAQVRACHGQTQKIVLAGYSQGNWVIRVALDALKRDHPDEWPDIVSSISGIGLVADPYNPLARPSLPAELDKGQTVRVCLPDDAVCNDPFTVPTGDVNCIITFNILCPQVRYGTEPTVPGSNKSAIQEISSSLQLGLLSPKIPGQLGCPRTRSSKPGPVASARHGVRTCACAVLDATARYGGGVECCQPLAIPALVEAEEAEAAA
jgi:hypothetical protein